MKIKHFLAALAIAVLAVPALAGAATIDEQISQLMAQIAELQAKIKTLEGQREVPVKWCHTFKVNMG